MDIIEYPSRADWASLSVRALAEEAAEVTEAVGKIMEDVATRGDDALRNYDRRFTGADVKELEVTRAELDEADAAVP